MNDKKDLAQQLENMQNQILEIQKKMTLVDDPDGDPKQDGNVGQANEATGEVDYEKQEKMSKRKMLISKMKAQV